MDVKMQEMNGFEAALHIKGINKNIPIVFQTAYAREFKKDEFMKNIGNGYIEKPFHKDQLINEVKLFVEIEQKKDHRILKPSRTIYNFISSIFHFF
jgi:CheY-like chemotaxis protein